MKPDFTQGFTQTQQDEDDWKSNGKKSRKQKEHVEHVNRVLSGRDATELYLQCYQLILWKQIHWLINSKAFPSELEAIVRDLWSLRARDLIKSADERGYGSASGTLYSSQSEGDLTDSDAKSVSSRRSRRSIAGEERLPKLVETLVLCYLGAVLLRLPSSLGDFFEWATQEDMIYTRAVSLLCFCFQNKCEDEFHS
jgi:RNA polymerase I-specific transcription initiation factor RRN7